MRLSYMVLRGKNTFAWGQTDIMVTLDEDIILRDVELIPVNNRGNYTLKNPMCQRLLPGWLCSIQK